MSHTNENGHGPHDSADTTNTQKAYRLIKEQIITTRLPPDAVVQEAALMVELGLGRTPIREALKQLEAERLIMISPRRGAFVAGIAISDLSDIQEVRSVLDVLCVRLAVARATPAERAQIRALVERARAIRESCSADEMLVLDRRTHEAIGAACHNKFLQAEVELFYNLALRIWYFYLSRLEPCDWAEDELEQIADAMDAGDAAAAEQAMRAHILRFGESIRRHL
jgi:DNA-binding GntR family transcriptional regulator